jgi:CheY-like chemotaxis protein
VNQLVALKLLRKLSISADQPNNGGRRQSRRPCGTTYDLILMDVQMPKVQGIAATREIRTHLAAYRQPFIRDLSADATTGSHQLCRRREWTRTSPASGFVEVT